MSGLIGALLGIASAWSLYWWKGRSEARAKLGVFLFWLEKVLYFHGDRPMHDLLEPKSKELIELAWDVISFSPLSRRTILALIEELRGHSRGLHRHAISYPNATEATRLVQKLLGLVGCPYEHGTVEDWPPK